MPTYPTEKPLKHFVPFPQNSKHHLITDIRLFVRSYPLVHPLTRTLVYTPVI